MPSELPSSDASAWTTLALLLRPQGRKGELLAELLTDFPQRFKDKPNIFLAPADFAGTADEARAMVINGYWLPVGRNQGRIVLGFEGIESITQAEGLEGLEVIVPRSERLELAEDEEYIDDLVGCVVYDGEQKVGVVSTIEFPTTPDGTRRLADAAPLLTVLSEAGDEILVPYVQSFVVSLSVAAKRIDMQLPAGLVELNRTDQHGSAEEDREAAAAESADEL